MTVKLTHEAERERITNSAKPTWEHLRTLSIVEAVRYARDNGWAEKKVQVRVDTHGDMSSPQFYVEPWEKDCTCPNILKYEDYFGSED